MTATEVRALRDGTAWETAFTSERERVLLDWVDAVAGSQGAVENQFGERLRAHWSDSEVVELTLVCAATMMLNRYCTALELPTAAGTVRRLEEAGLL